MRIIGQFNKGFILVQFRKDLYIIDQHAADEKFNFEKLLRSQEIEVQNMVQ